MTNENAAAVAEKPAPSPTADLMVIVKGTEKRAVLKDKHGGEHVLAPLDMADMCDYEAKIGTSLLSTDMTRLKIRDIVFLLYLSLRKEGLSAEDQDRGNFKITERQVQHMFDLSMIAKSGEVFLDLLRISGVIADPPKAS